MAWSMVVELISNTMACQSFSAPGRGCRLEGRNPTSRARSTTQVARVRGASGGHRLARMPWWSSSARVTWISSSDSSSAAQGSVLRGLAFGGQEQPVQGVGIRAGCGIPGGLEFPPGVRPDPINSSHLTRVLSSRKLSSFYPSLGSLSFPACIASSPITSAFSRCRPGQSVCVPGIG